MQLGTKEIASSSRVFAVKVQVILHSMELWFEGLMETDPFTHRSVIQSQIKIIVITLSSEFGMGFYCPLTALYSILVEMEVYNPPVSG